MSNGAPAPVWRWIGCGCGSVMVTVMLVVVVFSVLSYNQARQMEEGLADPEVRFEKVAGILHFDQLPAPYRPFGGLSLPIFLEMAVLTDLSDAELAAIDVAERQERFRERGFIYMSAWRVRRDDSEIARYFLEGLGPEAEGEEPAPPGPDFEVGFESREVLGRGAVEIAGGEALYVARRGELTLAGGERPGIATLLYLACQKDARMRFALWFGPDPGGTGTALAGSPADPAAIERFLGHFALC